MYNPPLLPLVVVPVLNTNSPLTPDVPASPVRINNAPLDVSVPVPLATVT
jgi:hypothetical protein